MYDSPSGQPYPGQDPYQSGPPPGYPPQFPAPQTKPKSKVPLVLGIIGGVLALCCVGGVVAVLVSNPQTDTTTGGTTPTTRGAAPEPSDSDITVRGDLDKLRKGDCFVEKPGIIKDSPVVRKASCTDPGAYQVLLRVEGTIEESACEETDYTTYYYRDADKKADQYIVCVKEVK
jgi:hypothetical protein